MHSNIPLTPLRSSRAILFDWGDTLMRVFPGVPGPMSTWPRVEAMPHALDTLADLYPRWTLCLATNAADSSQDEILTALSRVDLSKSIDRIYCYQAIKFRKPQPEFFAYILEDLELPPSRVVMVGDDYEADIRSAASLGIHAYWLHTRDVHMDHPLIHVIHDLSMLPKSLPQLR